MKKILIALLVCFSFVTAKAKDYSKYYQNLPVQMQQPTLPSIPDNHVSILECGGNGDGLTMNTQAFAKAILFSLLMALANAWVLMETDSP